jgi:hypothetical protein
MTRASILCFALAALALPACSKKDGGSAGGGGGGDKPAAVTLAKLGVQLDIAGEASPGDGMGDQSVMITGSEIGAMNVELKKEAKPLEEAKSDVSMYTGKNMKVETLADGYAVTFDNKGEMGPGFFVDVQRTIGGKPYSCSTTTNSAERQANVLAACKSLRAAGGGAAAPAPAPTK